MTELLISAFIKNKDDLKNHKVRQAYGTMGGAVGIFCNILLFAGKLTAGILTGAISITEDAFNNLSDAASSIITLVGFRMAGRPADKNHPFGHGRIEYISGLLVSLAILLMGFELLKSSADKIFRPEDIVFRPVSIGILIVSILVKFWMSAFNKKVGNLIDSEAMKATATDSLSDCIATTAVLGGMLIFKFAGINVDGYVGILVAGFVMWAGFGAAKDTLSPLLGTAPDVELVEDIQNEVLDNELIVGVHDIIVHDYGPGRRMISLHAEVPYNVDILEAHDVIDNIEYHLMHKFNCDATIHMDPVVTDDEETNEARMMVEKIVKECGPELSIHDFRMVEGKTHNNLIFDLVVPYECDQEVGDITTYIRKEIRRHRENYFAVIKVDRSYI